MSRMPTGNGRADARRAWIESLLCALAAMFSTAPLSSCAGGHQRGTVRRRPRVTPTVLGLAILATSGSLHAQGHERTRTLSVGTGWYDFVQKREPAWEARAEYRVGGPRPFRGLVVATMTGNSASFLGVGIGYELKLGRHLIATPTFAPGYYREGSGKDLGCALEFRSQFELGFQFTGGQRVSIAMSHMSNGGLGRINPGQESLTLAWQVPLNRRIVH
jgi:lipid A 3-O-deacylase